MKKSLLIIMLLTCLNSFGQSEISFSIPENATELISRKDTNYINYYILNEEDTMFFTTNSTVIQCDYLQSLDRNHNKCKIYIQQSPGHGKIELFIINQYTSQNSIYSGTISDGYFDTGTFIIKSKENNPVLTGQYLNNWKFGYWTTFHSDGKIISISKYIEGVDTPVKDWEFDENGNLLEYNDEEEEIMKRIKENNR